MKKILKFEDLEGVSYFVLTIMGNKVVKVRMEDDLDVIVYKTKNLTEDQFKSYTNMKRFDPEFIMEKIYYKHVLDPKQLEKILRSPYGKEIEYYLREDV